MNRDKPTITVKRSHGTVGQPENDKWIATLHLGGGGWGYYGNSAKEAEAGLRANEHRCEGVKAKVTDKPLYKLSSETVGAGRNKVTRWVTTPITFEDGTPLVTDDQGLIVTDPITEPSTPLERFDTDAGGSCCTECFAVSDDDYNGNAYPSMCVEPDCPCHTMTAPKAVEKFIAASVGMLLLIAIGAAAGVK